jgi:hypothetical protein
MHETPVLIFFLALVLSAVATIFWSLLLRYRRRELQHKERMAALEKGAALPALTDVESAPWTPRVYLLKGMIWAFTGIGLAAFLLAASITSTRPKTLEERAWQARSLREMGAPEDQIAQAQRDTSPHEGVPLGLSFIGLVPLGVGLAYLIFYRLEGKNMAALIPRE